MQRLWPAYCLIAALVTFGYALCDPYQLDGDAVSYMDIGDLIRRHQWSGVINGYWNPLYPALLAIGHILFRATRFTELHAYYMVNFCIFLLSMFAVVLLADALLQLRDHRSSATGTHPAWLLDRYHLRYIGLPLLVIASQRELSMGKIRPDALLQALLFLAVAALLKHLSTARPHYAALMGLALGFAYLTKSFAFHFAFLCLVVLIAFRLLWQRHAPARITGAALLALTCFAVVAGPYITALSLQKGRLDLGDSGNLNFAWFVSGVGRMHLQTDQPSRFGVADIHLKHPEDTLLQSPLVFSYKKLPYGTYPDWFDPSFWNEQIKTHINPHLQILAIFNGLRRLLRYLANHPEAVILLALLILLGARLNINWRPSSSNAFWLAPAALGLAVLCIYGLVCIEDRYISVGMLLLLLLSFASLRLPRETSATTTRSASSAAILLLALLTLGTSARNVGELRRNLIEINSPAGWYDPDIFNAAYALNAMGVHPGDTVACIGNRTCLNNHYLARLAGVRILTEIYIPRAPLYPALAAMPNRDQVIDLLRDQGDKVLIGYFPPGVMTGTVTSESNSVSTGWQELDGSHFYAYPLNLPTTTPTDLR
jgi:hypothetical protein